MIIAVANQKGGVGKTTTVVNLGTALARKGKTVLCIDFDPQANLTSYVACEPGEETVATVMRAAALFQPADVGAAVCHSDRFGFDFLPADLRLSEADIYLATAMSRETVLRRVLEPLRQAYDYILIDCNPSLGLLLTNVLVASDKVITEDISLHLADGAAPLTYVVTPEHFTGALAFASADESIVTVDVAGQVTPVAVGDTTVTVTAPNGLTATAAVHVWDGPKALTLTPGKTEITRGSGTQIAAADEAGNEVDAGSLTWVSSDESIATVTGGWVDMVGTGDVTITAATQHGISAAVDLTGVAPAPKPAASAPAGGSGSTGSQTYGGGAAPAASSDGALHTNWTLYADGTALDLINGIRSSVGASPLVWDSGLGDVAWVRCQQLLADFSHNGAQTPENIAMGIGDLGDAASVVAAWQASPGHYAAMVNTSFTRCAVVHIYDGDGCNFWCATFG